MKMLQKAWSLFVHGFDWFGKFIHYGFLLWCLSAGLIQMVKIGFYGGEWILAFGTPILVITIPPP